MPNQFLSPEGDIENYFVNEYWLIDQYVGDTLWVWGSNGSNRMLPINNSSVKSTPVTTFAGGTNWNQVSLGDGLGAAIKTDGTLWIWGGNSNGSLGINNTTIVLTPVTTFAGGTNWKQVSVGDKHTAAIKTDGTLWTWGDNSDASLGLNDSGLALSRSTPVTTFAGGTNWKQVSSGDGHVAAIKTDGTLWTWGRNDFGAPLGVNDANPRSTPVTTFAGGTNWKQVSCGDFYVAAIKTDGTLWTWGQNNNGQLGVNDTATRSTPVTTFAGGTNWKQVFIGYNNTHTAAIKTDGTLWTWGQNNNGQLGDNTTINKTTPVTTFAGGTNWKQVTCNGTNTAAIKTDGTLWTWGNNSYGQIGDNTSGTNRLTPVTTSAGGTNWKQVIAGNSGSPFGSSFAAVTSGTDPTYFIS
jgi:alpha-tubulin suppressor-like RCC1 family protein